MVVRCNTSVGKNMSSFTLSAHNLHIAMACIKKLRSNILIKADSGLDHSLSTVRTYHKNYDTLWDFANFMMAEVEHKTSCERQLVDAMFQAH